MMKGLSKTPQTTPVKTIRFIPPSGPEVRSPSEDFLTRAFLQADYAYWKNGECDAALEVVDADGRFGETQLIIRPGPPGLFCVQYVSNLGALALTANPKDHVLVNVFDGQEYAKVPRSHLVFAKTALQAALNYCRTLGKRDPDDYWIRYIRIWSDDEVDGDFDWEDERIP